MSKQVLSCLFFLGLLSFLISACLKDDFSKRADSVWNPDFAFPLVKSTLTVQDILIQDQSPTQIEINAANIVEIIYHSENKSDAAENLLELPEVNFQESVSMSAGTTQSFNQASANGSQRSDSTQFSYNFSLDSQLGSSSRLDTTYFKSGVLRLLFSSAIPQNTEVTVYIPGLFLNNQPFQQTLTFNSSGQTPITNELSRDLAGAYLVNDNQENFQATYVLTVTRTNPLALPLTNQVSVDFRLENPRFKRLNGFFTGLQMPVPNTDTLFLRLFKNVISADQLNFQNPRAKISVLNSTGIPLNSTIQSFAGFRNGVSIPPVNLSNVPFPLSVPKQSGLFDPPGRSDLTFTSIDGSNIENVVNAFPKYMITTSGNTLNHASNAGNFLLDTSKIRVYSEVHLPLDGLTLNLAVIDTFEFKFTDISRDIESALIRVNTSNGFPVGCKLQIYFCRQAENFANGQLTIIDSLYTAGTEPLLVSGVLGNAGAVVTPSAKISDAIISGEKWARLGNQEANRILVKGRFTTTAEASEIVKVKDGNQLDLRISAQIKVKKTF